MIELEPFEQREEDLEFERSTPLFFGYIEGSDEGSVLVEGLPDDLDELPLLDNKILVTDLDDTGILTYNLFEIKLELFKENFKKIVYYTGVSEGSYVDIVIQDIAHEDVFSDVDSFIAKLVSRDGISDDDAKRIHDALEHGGGVPSEGLNVVLEDIYGGMDLCMSDLRYREFMFDRYNPKGRYAGSVNMKVSAVDFAERIALLDGLSREEALLLVKPLLDVYNSLPAPILGACEMYKELQDSGYEIIFYTHSGEPWGSQKVEHLAALAGLDMDKITVCSVDLDYHKSASTLAVVVAFLGIDLDNAEYLGDNQISDIEAAFAVGFKDVIWLDRRGFCSLLNPNLPSVPQGRVLRVTNKPKGVLDHHGIENSFIN